ncbi:MAG: SGNH/GDSL hydrolase family protein [Verrucomicrobia bacterium]|nr:SGNH/GDSL hydrolase family protein [Verrucomicrobiota bacterium]
MLHADTEPDEGAIPADGRTYRGSIKPLNQESVAGVQFLLGNLTTHQVRGAKMLMGIASVVNSDQVPTNSGVTNNAITGNPHTGWVQVKIDGAADLPVDADPDGTGLAWTDLIAFSPTFMPGDGEIVWRLWVPNRATAPYAHTFSSNLLFGELSALRGLAMFHVDVLQLITYQNDSWMYYGYANSDAVTNPAVATTWTTTPTPPNHFDAYSKSYVTATPVLGYRWKATRNLPVIEFVGDSIAVGYGDHEQIVSVDGVPGRMIRALGSGTNAQFTFNNFGQSGYTPEQYLARWKGLAYADLTGATAMVYSIYSPNGFADGVHTTQARIDEMKQACLAAEQAAHDLGRIFIPMFITGTNMNLLNPNTARDGWSHDSTDLVKNLLDWAKTRYGNQLLDIHDVVQDSKTKGPAMQNGMTGTPSYTDDQTHPNTLGYDTLGARAVALFPTVYANARAAQARP